MAQETSNVENIIVRCKSHRKELDEILQEVKNTMKMLDRGPGAAEAMLAMRSIQLGVMWLGMTLKELGTPNPYPNSYNPENAIVDPTADGLKL